MQCLKQEFATGCDESEIGGGMIERKPHKRKDSKPHPLLDHGDAVEASRVGRRARTDFPQLAMVKYRAVHWHSDSEDYQDDVIDNCRGFARQC